MLPYATSKAALNWMTRKIHFENEWLVAFPLTPGPVKTDMRKLSFFSLILIIRIIRLRALVIDGIARDKTGLMKPFLDLAIQPPHAANALLNVIINSKRETHGGEFFDRDGKRLDW